jgi:excisionase family DNA binding protein
MAGLAKRKPPGTTEASRRLGTRPTTLAGFIDRGELPAYRFGRAIRIREVDLAEFLGACRSELGAPGDQATRDE